MQAARRFSCSPANPLPFSQAIDGEGLETKTLNPHADVAFVFAFVIIVIDSP